MTENKQQFTFSRILRRVKGARGSSGGARGRFEGAEAALLVVGVVLLAALLAAPRGTEPSIVPLPQPDRRTLSRVLARDAELAARARQRGLAFEVRAVGEALRRAGAATRPGQGTPSNLLVDVQTKAHDVLAELGPEPLLMLRALQCELFVAATHEWETERAVPPELRELGGEFAELAESSGWLVNQRLVLDDDERALLFRGRFGEVTRLGSKPPFAATLDERRESSSILLRHPVGADPGARAASQLRVIGALGKLDPDYPASYARGVVYFRAQAFEAAAAEFRGELAERPNGTWHLRAKNHLLAALAQLPAEE